MSDESQGPGWWLASDGKWYSPEQAPGATPSYPPPTYSPPAYTPPGGQYTPPSAGGQPLTAGTALSYGWAKYTANLGPILLIILIPFGVQLVLSLISRSTISSTGVSIAFSIIANIIGLMLSIGIFNAALMVTRGETPDIGRAFHSDRWVEWVVFAFVWSLMVVVGAIFCLVGAFVVVAIWGLAPYYFIDKNMSLGEALSASSKATSATPGLRVALALTALAGVAGVVLCFVGLLATLPMGYIGGAYLYRMANREPVAP
ncbi:MAG: hypothetical protein JWL83_3031 [Actinomycetia bacterium]|nr:hypothetical protein [Actinomycetes bacterium]